MNLDSQTVGVDSGSMQFFKPTASKIYLTLFLSISFFFAVLLWLIVFSEEIWTTTSLSAALIASCLLSVLIAYILSMMYEPIWKRRLFWQPTVTKAIIAVLFEMIFLVAEFFLYFFVLFPSPQGFIPCPMGSWYFTLTVCEGFNLHIFAYCLTIFSLINMCLSYMLSCMIVFPAHKMKKQ